jgi:uncharacterized repeat protein (TIGR01451 family)
MMGSRRIKTLTRLTVIGLIGMGIGWITAPAAYAASTPFPEGPGLVFVAQGTAPGSPTTLYEAVQQTGEIVFHREGTAAIGYNAMGARLADRLLYAINDNDGLVQVGQGGVTTGLGQVGLPPSTVANYNQGTFGAGPTADILYVRQATNNAMLFAIDVAASGTNRTTPIALDASVPNLSDFVYKDGFIWGIYGEGGRLYRINPATGHVISVPVTGLPANPYGAQWLYGNGNLGISNNVTGRVYQLRINNEDTDNPSVTIISSTRGPSNTQNDGASFPGEDADLSIVKTGPATWNPGDTITYELTVHNAGPGDSSGYIVRDMLPSRLLNAATASAGCDISDGVVECAGGPLDANGTGPVITITGTAPSTPGTDCVADGLENVATVTGNEGDPILTNNTSTSTACPDEHPAPSFTVSKTASIALPNFAAAGDTITYTVTVTNTGGIDYTAENPASFQDDLTNVLDDATLVPGSITGGATDGTPFISWSQPLAADATATITYQVTVNDPDTGNHVLTNSIVPGPTGSCGSVADCAVSTPVADFTVAKTAAPTHADAGGVVHYTITVHNAGAVNFGGSTAPFAPQAHVSDDVSGILADAAYNNDASNGGTLTGTTLSWDLNLPIGATVNLTYSFTVNSDVPSTAVLTNLVTPGDLGRCLTEGSCTTSTPVAAFTIAKTVDKTTARPGDKVTFTINVVNTGVFAFTDAEPATFTDDLSQVLDDATFNNDASAGATLSGTTLTWHGALPIGATVPVTFSVTVNRPDTGNLNLTDNAVAGLDGTCATEGGCTTVTTITPVRAYTIAKSVSPSTARPGDKVTYTLTVKNTGDVPYPAGAPASLSDNLSGVLDDARFNNDATQGAILNGTLLTWSGALPINGTVTITYSVTVNNPVTGDRVLANAATATAAGGSCATANSCSTRVSVNVAPPLPTTGMALGRITVGGTLLLLIGASLRILVRRRIPWIVR